jgi:nucleotide-binding universal stress UspA family protein
MSNEMTGEQNVEKTGAHILVALQPSPQSSAAMRAAAQLAAQLQAELHGLFVEDDNLYRLCSLPFAPDVGVLSGESRQLDSQAVARQMRALAMSLRQRLGQVADAMQVRWSFQVARGQVADELLAAAEDALLITLGPRRVALGALPGAVSQAIVQRSARPVVILDNAGRLARPFTVVYTGHPSAERALDLAVRLAQRTDQPIHVVLHVAEDLAAPISHQLMERLAAQGLSARFTHSDSHRDLRHFLGELPAGTLILPVEHADLITQLKGAMIVVP